MTKKIFFSITTICVASVIAAILLVTAVLYRASADDAAREVKAEARLIASAVEENGADYLRAADIDSDIRVTWIDSTGRVLFDSEEEAGSMENHSDRKEVSEAMEKGDTDAKLTAKKALQYYALLPRDRPDLETIRAETIMHIMKLRKALGK